MLLSILILMISISGCKASGKESVGNEDTGKDVLIDSNVSEDNDLYVNDNISTGQKDFQIIYPITVKGSDGKEVVLNEEPTRIISISPSITEIIASLNMLDKLIARSDYCDYPLDVLDIQSIGDLYAPDFEKIIELEPDLVIISTNLSDDSLAVLDSIGIKVIKLYEEHEFEGVYELYEVLGDIMNVSERADELILKMKEEISDITDRIKNVAKKTVYYAVSCGDLGDFTAGGDTYIHGLLSLAGAINIAEDVVGWTYSLEKIIEADPDFIFMGDYLYDEFISTVPYNDLKAVKNGNVAVVDNNILDRQSYRNVEAVREIAKALYPEAFK